MKKKFALKNTLEWTEASLQFIKKNFLIILTLGLVAGFGRAAQLRAFGEIPGWLDGSLEVVIQSARILIFIFALGQTNISNGIKRIGSIFSGKTESYEKRRFAWHKLKTNRGRMLWNMAVFLLISVFINMFIDHIAYETCLYVSLRDRGIINGIASEWTIILFLKNLSVIPLTLIFNAMCLLWLANKLPGVAGPEEA